MAHAHAPPDEVPGADSADAAPKAETEAETETEVEAELEIKPAPEPPKVHVEPAPVLPVPDDGLPEGRLDIQEPVHEWEARSRKECENEAAGQSCAKLYQRAAERIRYGMGADEAGGLLVHACPASRDTR